MGTDKQPHVNSALEEFHTQPRTKGLVSQEPEKDREGIKKPEDIKTNFPRSDETRHWNINLTELFIEHKWTFVRGRASWVCEAKWTFTLRANCFLICGDNCLRESRGGWDGKKGLAFAPSSPVFCKVWSWVDKRFQVRKRVCLWVTDACRSAGREDRAAAWA